MYNVDRESKIKAEITVLMTVYNGKEYLAEAVESILGQSFKDFEFIIINECGSDEETTNMLVEFAKKDNRIVLIHNEQKFGFTASLNKGLELAKGKYIARMDPDDVSVKERLQIQYDFMERNPDIIMCGGNIRYIQGDKLTRHTQRYLKRADQIRMSMLFLCEFAHPTVMFDREMFDKYSYRYDETIKTEDYELWSRIVFKHNVANVGKTLLYYRFHDNNSIKIDRAIVVASTGLVQQKILEKYDIFMRLENGIIDGMNTEKQLIELERGLHMLLEKNPDVFNNKNVFRNRMDVVYRNTEKKIGYSLNKHKRYWEKFGDLYKDNKRFLTWIDQGLYLIKDILWNILY